jgi:uncharacterized membrane protein YkoI
MKTFALFWFALAAPIVEQQRLLFQNADGIQIPYYYPQSNFETFRPVENSFFELSEIDVLEMGKRELSKEMRLPVEEVKIMSSFTSQDGTTHIYASRLFNGVVVRNQNGAIHIQGGKVVAMSSNVVPNDDERRVVPRPPRLTLEQAVAIAEQKYGIRRDAHEPSQVYIQVPSGALTLAYQFQLRNDDTIQWYQVSVDATTGQILDVVDFVQRISYEVLPLPKQIPTDGFEVVDGPIDPIASPLGWHNDGASTYNETIGNNVISLINNATVKIDENGEYRHKWNISSEPDLDEENQKAAIINNFYISNVIHDITYLFGFTEAAGNFQQDSN